MEKYHKVEKLKNTKMTKNMIKNFTEKLRNFNIKLIYNNNSDQLWADNNKNRVFMPKNV